MFTTTITFKNFQFLPSIRWELNSNPLPIFEFGSKINTRFMIFLAHVRRPATLLHQLPGHAMIGGKFQMYAVGQISGEVTVATNHEIEL